LPADIHYVDFPEQALELITTLDIGVLVSELQMDVMSADELFMLTESLRPNTVKILMTEVLNQGDFLSLYNHYDIFSIVLKPLKFTEDIINPVKEGIDEYHKRVAASRYVSETKENTRKVTESFDQLKKENIKRSREYSNIYTAFCGLMEANLTGLSNDSAFDEEERRSLKRFIQNITRAYIDTFVFSDKNNQELWQSLIEEFTNEAHGSTVTTTLNEGFSVSNKKAKEIYFAGYLMCQLCRSTLTKYTIVTSLDLQQGYYIFKFVCDLKESSLDGKIMYSETNKRVRKVMHSLVSEILSKIYTKSVKGYEDNPYVGLVMIAAD